MKPEVAVLGATGQLGLFAVAGLLEAGRKVVAITRRPPSCQPTEIEGLRCLDMGQFAALVREGCKDGYALLSCGPAALALEAITANSPRRFERAIVIGTTSTVSKRDSPDDVERRNMEDIERDLGDIRARCQAAGMPLTVLSPTLIYGCGMDQNLSRVYRFIQWAGFAPVAAKADGIRQPLHVADLADTVVNALQAEPAPALESPVCGGSTLGYAEMIGELFEAAGRRRRFLHLPAAIFPLVAGVSRVLPGFEQVSSEMFRRQSRDLVFDDRPARRELGHAPRPFQPSEADFRPPPRIESIRHALNGKH